MTPAEVEKLLHMPLVDAMTTQRAIRRLKPDPVDDRLVLRLIELATHAPTGGNRQNWAFVVVKDRPVMARLGKAYRQAWPAFSRIYDRRAAGDERLQKILAAVEWQIEHWDEVPVAVVACLEGPVPPVPQFVASSSYGSIFPAVQNLLLSARAVGLGAALVTLPLWSAIQARRILGLPFTVTPCAVVPMGWPRGRYGPVTRAPVGDVVHLDRWGNQPWSGQRASAPEPPATPRTRKAAGKKTAAPPASPES